MTAESNRKVIVVGAGIIGLTTAIRLREDGHEVLVLTKQRPSSFFSRQEFSSKEVSPFPYSTPTSTGIWVPTNLEGNLIRQWATKTFERFKKEAEGDVSVEMLEGYALHRNQEITDLPWFSKLTKVGIETPASDKNVPATHKSAFRYEAPLVDIEQYLIHLEEQATGMGITFHHSNQGQGFDLDRVCALANLQAGEKATIVNCCGLGAETLSGDKMIPGRGLTVTVSRPLGVNHFVLEDEKGANEIREVPKCVGFTCVPRGKSYVLGSNLKMGSSCREADNGEAERILEKCAEILPKIKTAKVEKVTVGFRPFTEDFTVRIGKQFNADCEARGIELVANYGHGGRGITLCWGCADEVANIIAGFENHWPRDANRGLSGVLLVGLKTGGP